MIAFVSTPAFDPNLFARGLSRPQYLALTEDPDRPMYDRALRGVYPPGSTVKPMFALAALETGVVTPLDTRYCRGRWSAPGYGRVRRDWKPEGHGTVDMRKAIATSCDVYFFDIARLMGIDRMASFVVAVRPGRADRHRHRRRAQRHPAVDANGRSAPTKRRRSCRSGFPATRSASASVRDRCS